MCKITFKIGFKPWFKCGIMKKESRDFLTFVTWNIYSYSYVVYKKKYTSITMSGLLKMCNWHSYIFFRNVNWHKSYFFQFCSSILRFHYCIQVHTELIGHIPVVWFSKLLSLLVIFVEHLQLNLLFYHYKESKIMYIIHVSNFACSNCLHLPHYKTLKLIDPIFYFILFYFWGEGEGVIQSNDNSKTDLFSK